MTCNLQVFAVIVLTISTLIQLTYYQLSEIRNVQDVLSSVPLLLIILSLAIIFIAVVGLCISISANNFFIFLVSILRLFNLLKVIEITTNRIKIQSDKNKLFELKTNLSVIRFKVDNYTSASEPANISAFLKMFFF